jgi:AraC family transcriptional regulator of adaptative response/methylated-DNA-[protein]-cysteine methyltransferase
MVTTTTMANATASTAARATAAVDDGARPAAPVGGDTARWRAVCARDAAADGTFVFAVATTGIYCRPSCPARRPHRRNVSFLPDGAAARAAGFRACKRCAPDAVRSPRAQRDALVAEVCRWLDAAERPPTLGQLASRAGYSPFHLQRVFVATTGLSPRAWATARRAERLRTALRGGATVTAAMHCAGYGSTRALHADGERALGMQPRRARAGGAGETIEYAVARSTLGETLVAATERGVCAILLGDDDAELEADLRRRFPRAELRRAGPGFRARLRAAIAHVDGDPRAEALPLDLRGTAFQQRVWRELRRVRSGTTTSYAAIAARLGMPNAARAVGAAIGSNPVAVVVPCHRVLRSDGQLCGYRWGVDKKRALLERERGVP